MIRDDFKKDVRKHGPFACGGIVEPKQHADDKRGRVDTYTIEGPLTVEKLQELRAVITAPPRSFLVKCLSVLVFVPAFSIVLIKLIWEVFVETIADIGESFRH